MILMIIELSSIKNYLKGFAPMPPAPCFFVEWWLRGEVVTSERVTSLAWCLRKARETKKGSKSKF